MADASIAKKDDIPKNQRPNRVVTLGQGLTSIQFWMMFFMLFFGLFYGAFNASVFKTLDAGNLSDKALSTIAAIGSIANCTARILLPTL